MTAMIINSKFKTPSTKDAVDQSYQKKNSECEEKPAKW